MYGHQQPPPDGQHGYQVRDYTQTRVVVEERRHRVYTPLDAAGIPLQAPPQQIPIPQQHYQFAPQGVAPAQHVYTRGPSLPAAAPSLARPPIATRSPLPPGVGAGLQRRDAQVFDDDTLLERLAVGQPVEAEEKRPPADYDGRGGLQSLAVKKTDLKRFHRRDQRPLIYQLAARLTENIQQGGDGGIDDILSYLPSYDDAKIETYYKEREDLRVCPSVNVFGHPCPGCCFGGTCFHHGELWGPDLEKFNSRIVNRRASSMSMRVASQSTAATAVPATGTIPQASLGNERWLNMRQNAQFFRGGGDQ
uniref:Uncharacterized protein n=1 Tax=Chromera velia CCMP2878 TaxID=1169474 RepID=A0A0G4HC63_9ALVE|mmetsp:Transcript_17638/g.35797  ORF Transcript_17638/g.35797 Transcript_17638/m.35797 type:complete len:306 (-) Transcript_17638:253-1170(-)|eukprot:Cvel_6291.t1-p1 / transcript=Cvel_6291.t1 / gene=Cvel_6291 / organism=Chromera_velia_CCMP2878 / gene_product=hypothetical protein / transcript_product=hypothetical protein / location=Cvel_scaffold305:55031-57666(-) / protein_length=305 / sequence_SO=supercontig / SO=protein_coding / is_pseudo=false